MIDSKEAERREMLRGWTFVLAMVLVLDRFGPDLAARVIELAARLY